MPLDPTAFERHTPAASVVAHSLAPTVAGSFWLDDLTSPTRWEALTGAHRYDLAVVGGGYTGLWTALLAKQRDPGRSVVVLEGRTVGWAASGRNGGFIEASLTHGDENGTRRWPEEMPALDRLGLRNLDEIESTVRELGLDCDFERTGSLTVATEPYQAAALDRGDGYLDGAAVRAELDSPTYLAGVWDPHSVAIVHPAKLAAELARACVEAGVEIYEHSPAKGIEGSGGGSGGVLLRGDRFTVTADRVALATNAFPSLLKRYRLHTVPVWDYALMTEPLSDTQLASLGWKNRQGVSDLANQFHYYRLSADNRILWGGYDAIYRYGGRIRAEYDERPATHELLASHFFTTFPQLEGLTFTHRWGGVIDSSTRFCAFFGSAHRGRVAYAAGFTGLGVGATRFAADVMLDRLAGLDTERTRLRMVREMPPPFPPEPIASLGIQATRWSMDRADHNGGRRNLLLTTLGALGLGFDS